MIGFLVLPLLLVCSSAVNPGIVIGMPLPYSLPAVELVRLPYALQNFTIQSAEFTNVQIKQLDFNVSRLLYKKKTIFIKECMEAELALNLLRVHFDFEFDKSSGPGDFFEQGLYILVEFDLINNNSKPQIDIKRIQMDIGKIKVVLGGSVEDRILSKVTQLLLQFGQPIIHSQIKKLIKDKVDKYNKNFVDDFKLLDVSVDGSLVSTPLIEPDFVTLNLNGAAFLPNTKPKQLNPPDLLKINKTNKNIQMLLHELVFSSAIATEFQKTPLNKTISTMDITSVININSQTLSPLFPAMINFPQIQDVLLTISQNGTKVAISNGVISIDMSMISTVETCPIGQISKRTVYMNPAKANLHLELGVNFGQYRTGVIISNLDLASLYVNPSDVTASKVNPDALTKYIPVLAQWIASAFNGNLGEKSKQVTPYGLTLAISGQLFPHYLSMDLKLI